MKRNLFTAAFCLLALNAAVFAEPQDFPAASASASQAAPDDPRWTAIIQQLGDDDFQKRESAQKDLDKSTWRELDLLQRAAEKAADPEIKARLQARIGTISEELAVNPPPLSFQFKAATVADIAAAFSKSLNIKLDVWPPFRGNTNELYNLSATDKPLWEIVMQLSQQHGIQFMDMGDRVSLRNQSGNGWRHGVIVGPAAIFPESITRQRTSALQNDKGAEIGAETMNLSCTVVIDPRVPVVKYASPSFSEITDDAGNVLYKQDPPNDNLWDTSGRTISMQNASASLQIPEKKGTRIASAKGTLHYLVQTGEEHIDVTDLEKKKGQTVDVGGATVRVGQFTVQGGGDNMNINMSFDLVKAPDDPNAGALDRLRNGFNMGKSNGGSVTATLFDATGRIVHTSAIRGSMGAGIGGGGYVPPFKLRLAVATKTKDVTLPFELKDLPLP